MTSDVTFVLTSCGRMDLLDQTLESFFKQNTYPLKAIYVIEDSYDQEVYKQITERWGDKVTLFLNDPKLGQIASIEKVYAMVDTPYVFHCEDDWLFTRPGFMEENKAIMESDPSIIQVWLESKESAARLDIFSYDNRKEVDGLAFERVNVAEGWEWGYFSFRPGLKRMSDYKRLGGYGQFLNELDISVAYRDMGYHTVIIEEPAIEDLGEGRTVPDPTRKWPTRRKSNKPKGLKRLWSHIHRLFTEGKW